MSKFTIVHDNFVTATHIAELLNKHNKLNVHHTGHSIMLSNTEYIIEQRALKNQIIVAGCIGVNVISNDIIFLKHLCVHEHFRGLGIASTLIKSALIKSPTTKAAFMDIRSDNVPSLSLATKEGFLVTHCKYLNQYNLITVGKIK